MAWYGRYTVDRETTEKGKRGEEERREAAQYRRYLARARVGHDGLENQPAALLNPHHLRRRKKHCCHAATIPPSATIQHYTRRTRGKGVGGGSHHARKKSASRSRRAPPSPRVLEPEPTHLLYPQSPIYCYPQPVPRTQIKVTPRCCHHSSPPSGPTLLAA